MPGRHGKQRVVRKKSKRLPVTQMERTLKDSIHGRKRKERQILRQLIPPRVLPKMNKLTLSATLPMFEAAATATAHSHATTTTVTSAAVATTAKATDATALPDNSDNNKKKNNNNNNATATQRRKAKKRNTTR